VLRRDEHMPAARTQTKANAVHMPCVACHSTGYKIMVMDVMYDDTTLKVMGIHERNSLAPDDVSAVVSMDSAHLATATPFPESDLTAYPPGLSNEVVLANSRAWCQARSSGGFEVWVGLINSHSNNSKAEFLIPIGSWVEKLLAAPA